MLAAIDDWYQLQCKHVGLQELLKWRRLIGIEKQHADAFVFKARCMRYYVTGEAKGEELNRQQRAVRHRW